MPRAAELPHRRRPLAARSKQHYHHANACRPEGEMIVFGPGAFLDEELGYVSSSRLLTPPVFALTMSRLWPRSPSPTSRNCLACLPPLSQPAPFRAWRRFLMPLKP